MGSIVLLPVVLLRKKTGLIRPDGKNSMSKLITGIIITGLVLFCGASFQQVGIQSTTAGKAGFITGLYVVFVPVAGIFFGHRTKLFMWVGVALSAIGLYFLSIKSNLTMDHGDFLVFLCAISFTAHVLIIAWLSPKMDSYLLACVQFAICAFLSIIVAFATETIIWSRIMDAALPVLYGGILSVGVAFTLQIIGQKHAHPTFATIILSFESVFAAIGGWLILDEHLSFRALAGCLLMLTGMVTVQLKAA